MARRTLDQYNSPVKIVDHLLNAIYPDKGATILEPCVGSGVIAHALKELGYKVLTNDIDPTCSADAHKDYLNWTPLTPIAWVITNPPYSLAYEMLQKAREEAVVGVAFFLRLSFLEPTRQRGRFLSKYPPDGLLVLPRYSFTGDGNTDNVTAAWMIWNNLGIGRQWIKIVKKEER